MTTATPPSAAQQVGIPDDDRYDLGVFAVLRVVAGRWWIVAIVLALSLSTTIRRVNATVPMYESSSKVLISEASADVVIGIAGYEAVDPVRTMDTQIVTAQTHPVWQGVWDRLGVEDSSKIARLEVDKEGVSDVMVIKVQSTDPNVAVKAATAFAESYVAFRKLQIADYFQTLAESLSSRAALYGDQVNQLSLQIAEMSGRSADVEFFRLLASAASPNSALNAEQLINGGGDNPELTRLIAERESVLSLQLQLETRADEVNFGASAQSAGPSILGETEPATGPLGASSTRQIIVAVISGVAGGIALAFSVDFLDDKLRRRDEVEKELHGIPVLGASPPDRSLSRRTNAVATLHRPVSATADAYRSIRSAIQARSMTTPVQTVLVTSPDRREGKTTAAAELGVIMARGGKNVVLVDANLRRPRLHRRLGIAQEPGLSSVLAGEHALSTGMVELPLSGSAGRLRVLPAGPLTDGLTHVLDGHRTVEVLRAIQADADLVIIDAPHLNRIADAQVMSSNVDAVLVVVRKKITKRRRLGAALDVLSKSGVPVVWTLLNGFGTRDLKAARRAARRTGDELKVPTTGGRSRVRALR